MSSSSAIMAVDPGSGRWNHGKPRWLLKLRLRKLRLPVRFLTAVLLLSGSLVTRHHWELATGAGARYGAMAFESVETGLFFRLWARLTSPGWLSIRGIRQVDLGYPSLVS